MSWIEALMFLLGWSGWLVMLAKQVQLMDERESRQYWMKKYLRYKRENPPHKPRKVAR